ncbi:MAG: nucleoside hydrolase [Pseudomonadales bacterium]|jgi:purine nucleosidase|nr:nucleoside hydrolase [Pseudomonadales bacterium]MCP5337774.1 nucleoside hydrolase [Pseudomonadales bacterium]
MPRGNPRQSLLIRLRSRGVAWIPSWTRKGAVFGSVSLVWILFLLVSGLPVRADDPVGLVFDTDMCGDVDDVLALGMIHAMQSRGDARLLAVTVSVDDARAAPFVDLVNTFYGRGSIPVGTVGAGGPRENCKYLPMVDIRDQDRLRYPHDQAGFPLATRLLRQVLAAQPDQSVVIVQVGFSTNLARLLDTPGDDISPLTGTELVKAKVRFLSLMAGAFAPVEGNARYLEYNVVKDIPSCAGLVARWPTGMVFSGFEIGMAARYPGTSIERDYKYVAHHPLAEAYYLYLPPPHNRPTWDLTSVLYAVHPERGYFDLSPPGDVAVASDGFTEFTPNPQGRDHYLILPDEARKARVLEALVQLASQPPDRRNASP